VIILALFTMGAVSGEQKSGITEMILVKPVSYSNYVSAKWTSNMLLILVSLSLSISLSWYYINLLFGKLSIFTFFLVLLLLTLWFCLFLSISIFFNVLLKSPGAVAACTIGTYFLTSALDIVIGNRWSWFPSQVFFHIQHLLVNGNTTSDTWG